MWVDKTVTLQTHIRPTQRNIPTNMEASRVRDQARIDQCAERERVVNAAYQAALDREGGNHWNVDHDLEEARYEAAGALRLAQRAAAAHCLQGWARARVLPRPRAPKAVVDRGNPAHDTCPVCAGPLVRCAPSADTGGLFVVLCPRCHFCVGDGTRAVRVCDGGHPFGSTVEWLDEEERAHYYEEGDECHYCEYERDGCQCDAGIYANTYVEMRCECGPCAVGDHAEKYAAYQRLERTLRAAAVGVKRPKSAGKRGYCDVHNESASKSLPVQGSSGEEDKGGGGGGKGEEIAPAAKKAKNDDHECTYPRCHIGKCVRDGFDHLNVAHLACSKVAWNTPPVGFKA